VITATLFSLLAHALTINSSHTVSSAAGHCTHSAMLCVINMFFVMWQPQFQYSFLILLHSHFLQHWLACIAILPAYPFSLSLFLSPLAQSLGEKSKEPREKNNAINLGHFILTATHKGSPRTSLDQKCKRQT
jgi:hypothetical protein